MTRLKVVLFVTLLLGGLGALLVWQQRALQELRAENSALRRTAAEMEAAREESARLAQTNIDPAEVQRLRAGQSELLRLRAEVSQLRQQLKTTEAGSAKRAASAPDTASTPIDPPGSPVQTYVANTRASVMWQQTLITGGWKISPGKRALVFVQPQTDGANNQLMVQTRIIEVPEEVLSQVGLDALKSDDKQSFSQAILSSGQSDIILKALEKANGVQILFAPKVTTLDGRQAQVNVMNEQMISGATYQVGPSVDIMPRISPDHTSVDLTVSAQLRLPSGQ